jgi:hypothetical protein
MSCLFSEAICLLIGAREEAGGRCLVAFTGVGAGETRGYSGFLYDWITCVLFLDKPDRVIRASYVGKRPAGVPHARRARTVLRRMTRAEVAKFVLDQLQSDQYLRTKPFISRPQRLTSRGITACAAQSATLTTSAIAVKLSNHA